MARKALYTRLLILVTSLLVVTACSKKETEDLNQRMCLGKSNEYCKIEYFPVDLTNKMDNGDLCPKESYTKFQHHFVLIDSTSGFNDAQAALVKRLTLSDESLARIAPWDRLSIMNMSVGGMKPSKNETVFSKCRPRSGDPASIHPIDKIRKWSETIKDVTPPYEQLFVQGVKDALAEIKKTNVSNAPKNDPLKNSPLMGQVKEIFRLDNLKFNKDEGYKSRKLTIVSDMVQSSANLDFYKACGRTKKCPSWDKFKTAKKNEIWAKNALPTIGDNVEIEIVYLNSNFDPQLDRNIKEFWDDFFLDAGTKISKWHYEAEQQ